MHLVITSRDQSSAARALFAFCLSHGSERIDLSSVNWFLVAWGGSRWCETDRFRVTHGVLLKALRFCALCWCRTPVRNVSE